MKMICIACPVGCSLDVTREGDAVHVQGNGCARGVPYARQELLDPQRIVTSTVPIACAHIVRLPVRTRGPVSKGKIADVLRALRGVRVQAPVRMGTVILANVAGTGVDVIASRSL